ncbi:MAG: hypothetical protein KDK45_22690, partial [Leptospiraceae bacterium]|nr:hypothetical protein [Leptospiraceae bacterium]
MLKGDKLNCYNIVYGFIKRTHLTCILLSFFLSSCGTYRNLQYGIKRRKSPVPYGGVMFDGYSALVKRESRFFLDLPLSLAADTVLLPIVLPWFLIEMQIRSTSYRSRKEEAGYQLRKIINAGGHSLQIQALAFSPDGKLLATGSIDDLTKIWSIEGGLLASFKTGDVGALAFSPDGKLLAAASEDEGITLWNVPENKLEKRLGTETRARYITFSPDGKQLLCTSYNNGTVKLIDLSGKVFLKLDVLQARLAIFNREGTLIITGGDKLMIWNRDGKLLKSWDAYGPKVLRMDLHSNIRSLGGGKSLYVWSEDGKLLEELPGAAYSSKRYFVDDEHILGCFDSPFRGCKLYDTTGNIIWEFASE